AVVWAIARWPAAAALAVVGIGLVYQFAPARRRQWRWLTPGAVFAAGTWFAMSLVLRLYVVTLGNYNATYGSIAGVILTLLWLYLSGLALLLGAELDAELRGDANHTPPDRQAASGTEIPGHAR